MTLVSYDAMSRFLAKAAQQSSSSDLEPAEPPSAPPTPVTGNVHRLVNRYPDETELMRKLTPTLLHDLLRTISDLEHMMGAAAHSK